MRKTRPTISIKNWNDWCGLHTWNLANAQDPQLWQDYADYATETMGEVDFVEGGETHHLRMDLEHMRPYIEEGAYDA